MEAGLGEDGLAEYFAIQLVLLVLMLGTRRCENGAYLGFYRNLS